MADKKFRLKVSFFDIIIIVLAIAAVLIFYKLTNSRQGTIASEKAVVTYTVEASSVPFDTADYCKPGDSLKDNIKNYSIGTVKEVSVKPSKRLMNDYETGEYIESANPDFEDVTIVIEVIVEDTETAFIADGGYTIRTGLSCNFSGPCYTMNGYITNVKADAVMEEFSK